MTRVAVTQLLFDAAQRDRILLDGEQHGTSHVLTLVRTSDAPAAQHWSAASDAIGDDFLTKVVTVARTTAEEAEIDVSIRQETRGRDAADISLEGCCG